MRAGSCDKYRMDDEHFSLDALRASPTASIPHAELEAARLNMVRRAQALADFTAAKLPMKVSLWLTSPEPQTRS